MNNKVSKTIIKVVTIIFTILTILFIIYGINAGIFNDKDILVNYINSFGVTAPLVFMIIQMLQVVFPVIPGGVSSIAGVLAFGSIKGFIYNYIGLCIGSCVSFTLSKKYSLKIVNALFKEETVNKYLKYIKNNTFNKIFLFGILLPGFPDDFLCYIAGLSNITLKKFITIILICKIPTLIIYSVIYNII